MSCGVRNSRLPTTEVTRCPLEELRKSSFHWASADFAAAAVEFAVGFAAVFAAAAGCGVAATGCAPSRFRPSQHGLLRRSVSAVARRRST